MPLESTLVLPASKLPLSGKEALPEDLLIQYLQAQDKRAITFLYDAYSPALYGVILRIVRSPMVAEDILQECFVKIWITFDSYDRTRGKLFTWLINIARYAAIDKLRSRSHLKGLKTYSLDVDSGAGAMLTQDFHPEYIGVRELTDKLSFKHKTILDLMYFEGFSQQEIADKLNIPLGTVKTLSRRALQLLRILLR